MPWSVIAVVLSETEGSVQEAICVVCVGFFINMSRTFLRHPVRLLGVRLVKLSSCSLYELFFCLALVNAIAFSISVCCWIVSHFRLSC